MSRPAERGVAWQERDDCRGCGGRLEQVLGYGAVPIADRLVSDSEFDAPDPRVPLDLARCTRCGLVQLVQTVAPEALFGADYPYLSSTSEGWRRHCAQLAEEVHVQAGLGPGSLVVEPGSNDGTLLGCFAARGSEVLGVDPSGAPVERARAAGVPTLRAPFGCGVADALVSEGRRARAIVATNVLAHVADLHDFLAGLARLLAPDGMATLEVPYVADLLTRCELDTVYHQHLCYFALAPLAGLAAQHGLQAVSARRIDVHGGSLRVTLRHRPAVPDGTIPALLEEEARLGLADAGPCRRFAERAQGVRERLRSLLAQRRADGRRLAAYGAAAKGTTLLAWCGLGRNTIEFVVDRNPLKHGRHLPGSRLPIRPTEALLEPGAPPDALLLAWNWEGEIVRQQAEFRSRGGRFVIPLPEPRVV